MPMANHDESPNAEILLEFVAESRETLDRVQPLLNELERGGTAQSETLAVVFRCFHSFAGTASFLELSHIARLAHSAESLLDLFRRGAEIRVDYVDAVRRAIDTFRVVLESVGTDYTDKLRASACSEQSSELDEIVDAIVRTAGPGVLSSRRWRARSAAKRGASTRPRRVDDESELFEAETAQTTAALPEDLLVRFGAESDEHLAKVEEVLVALESGWASADQLGDAFRALHSFKGNCGICGFADMEKLTHRAETLVGEFRDKSRAPDEQSVTTLLECVDVLRAVLATLPGGDGTISQLPSLLERLSWLSTSQVGVDAAESIAERVAERGAPSTLDNTKGSGSIRVDTRKLDELMNLVGELIIAETTVTRNPDLEGYEFENFQKAALNLNRLTRALQDITMAVRMVPIAATFRKMVRLVRDVSSKRRKKVELVLTGQDTEVDKTLIESIGDPIVHLIRNSIDHGIEAPEERINGAKVATGRIWLDARHQGGEVWITVRDDGRGLEPERIMKKAIERGLADASRQYTEREVFEFIFAPGFSTASQITEISGRGVGLDVVRRNIEGVNGRVEVGSEPGKGAVFTLRVPLTLAIIEGMLVRVGRSYYTIPLLSIRESVKAGVGDITILSDGSELLKLRRRHYPIIKLTELHAVEGAIGSASDGILVVLESGERLACVLVDEVVGQRQTVIKPLPEYLERVRGVAGCSIMHNGEISLILDVEAMVGTAASRAA